jgi:RNA polymerase sigma-70 factor (ECF subfamily)
MPAFDDGPGGEPDQVLQPPRFDMPTERWRRLFASCAAGEPGAMEQLYDTASGTLYGFAVWATGSRDDAADVVAEAFVRVAEHGDRLLDVRYPRAWLLTVTRRLAVDLARRRQRRPTEPLAAAELVVAPANDPDRALDARRASRLLSVLARHHREVVFLRHFGDCTFRTIGTILGIPTFTAASRYRLAIRRLRRLMGGAP